MKFVLYHPEREGNMKQEPGSTSDAKQVVIQLPREFYEEVERRATFQGLEVQEVMGRALEAFLGIRRNLQSSAPSFRIPRSER